MITSAIELVRQWQESANQQNVSILLNLSDPHIEIVGPRGSAHGHQVLSEWVQRAGAHFTTLRVFARDDRVAVAQHAEWRSPETGEVTGEADVASSFRVEEQRVMRVARFDSLDQALHDAGLTIADEHQSIL